jgi:hypothetical protein
MTGVVTCLVLGAELAGPDVRPQCAAAPHACQKCQTVEDSGWKREGYPANVGLQENAGLQE